LLSALSKDFSSLIKACVVPLMWVSGIIFDVRSVAIPWIKTLLMFNPITFFSYAFRDAIYYKAWIWNDLASLGIFGLVFLVTVIVMLFLYKQLHREVSDALA
jgi:ABC-type polysaccharide/polyol phosphate export permease